jgi:large subunit ribosomal protein L25
MWGARGVCLWRGLERTRTAAAAAAASHRGGLQTWSLSREAGAALAQEPVGVQQRARALPVWWLERRYSASAQLEGDSGESEQLLPKEEETPEEVIKAVPRSGSGKIVSKKERRAGRAPSIVFSQENGHVGGDKQLISVETKQIERLLKRLGKSFFLSKTFDLELCDEEGNVQARERVLPRSIHLHAGTDKVMNVTFIRAPPTALLKVDVPLVFIGEDACPGIRKGGYIYTMMRTVKYKCPGDAIPTGIEVDLSSLDMGEKILLKDLKASPGISLVKRDSSLPVCKVMGSRTSSAAAGAAAAS